MLLLRPRKSPCRDAWVVSTMGIGFLVRPLARCRRMAEEAGRAAAIISSIGSDHARFNEGQFSVMPFASRDAFTLLENMGAGLLPFVFLEPAKLCFKPGTWLLRFNEIPTFQMWMHWRMGLSDRNCFATAAKCLSASCSALPWKPSFSHSFVVSSSGTMEPNFSIILGNISHLCCSCWIAGNFVCMVSTKQFQEVVQQEGNGPLDLRRLRQWKEINRIVQKFSYFLFVC